MVLIPLFLEVMVVLLIFTNINNFNNTIYLTFIINFIIILIINKIIIKNE